MRRIRPIIRRDDHFITAKEAAASKGVDVRTIYRAMNVFSATHGRQGLKFCRLVSARVTNMMWLDDWIKQRVAYAEVENG